MLQKFTRIFRPTDLVAVAALIACLLLPLTWPVAMPLPFWLKQSIEAIFLGLVYLAHLLFIYPVLGTRRNKWWYIIAILLLVGLNLLAMRLVSDLLLIDQIYVKAFSTPEHKFEPNHSFYAKWLAFLSFLFIGFSYVSAISKRLRKNQLAFEISEKERVQAELSFLKAQINPHFFFNTLHTIYALMDTNPTLAKRSIYSLSHLMRYVLYETKIDRISLFKELSFIEDYIELMKVRQGENVQIIYDVQQGLPDLQIAPMLILPFVENAFKHGISAVSQCYIFIHAGETDKELKFEIRNSLFKPQSSQLERGEGIGIANVKRRLDLLYPGQHTLSVEKDELAKEHIVTLTITK